MTDLPNNAIFLAVAQTSYRAKLSHVNHAVCENSLGYRYRDHLHSQSGESRSRRAVAGSTRAIEN
jgi:hypothetical protein